MANADGAKTGPDMTPGSLTRRDERARLEWAQKQAREERDFYTHLGTYAAVILGLFVLDLLTGGSWWFYWPAIGWGIGILIHGFTVFSGTWIGPDREARRTQQLLAERESSERRAGGFAPGSTEQNSSLSNLIRRGTSAVNGMRADAERIDAIDVRERALGICDRADGILRVLAEPGRDELLASEFVEQVLGPAESLLTNYTRLSERQIASASPALRRVESRDLPLLEQTLDDIHERLHQDDLVSLEVASEMLSLGRAIGVKNEAEFGERP